MCYLVLNIVYAVLSNSCVGFTLFIFSFNKLKGEKVNWALTVSVSFLIIVYVGFGLLLKLPLYEGILFQ